MAESEISTDTTVPAAAAGGYVLELIAEETVEAGIAANEDFIAEWLGTLEIDLDFDSGNSKTVDFELHFNHTIRVGGTEVSFDAVREVHYRINKNSPFVLPLNVFNFPI